MVGSWTEVTIGDVTIYSSRNSTHDHHVDIRDKPGRRGSKHSICKPPNSSYYDHWYCTAPPVVHDEDGDEFAGTLPRPIKGDCSHGCHRGLKSETDNSYPNVRHHVFTERGTVNGTNPPDFGVGGWYKKCWGPLVILNHSSYCPHEFCS